MSRLKAATQIRLPDPLCAPPVKQIFDALGQDTVRFVGGCVRNALIDRDIADIDLATILPPEDVIQALEAKAIKAVPTGIEHGTVTAVNGPVTAEITTLRKDIGTDGRHAVVAFTQDWTEDAKRRDFTMNTLSADIEGRIFDPTGQGLKDLKARRVVFVGDPAQRIAEDYLRILRYFRFHGSYGVGAPHEEALKACGQAAENIERLSKERITQEIFKILSLEDPSTILALMFENGVMQDLPAPDFEMERLSALCRFQKRFKLFEIASRLFVMGSVQHLSKYLLVPKRVQKDMQAIAAILDMPDLNTEQTVKAAVYRHGRTASAQSLMIEHTQDRLKTHPLKSMLDLIHTWDIPDFPVTGDDLIKQGFHPGPKLGAELKRLEDEWIKRGFV